MEPYLKQLLKPPMIFKTIGFFLCIKTAQPVLPQFREEKYLPEKKAEISPVQERHTCCTAGIAFGDRSAETCRELWKYIHADYRKRAVCCTDLRENWQAVLPSEGSGETAHTEHFNNTLRQRCPNLVRKTLSFSRDDDLHKIPYPKFY